MHLDQLLRHGNVVVRISHTQQRGSIRGVSLRLRVSRWDCCAVFFRVEVNADILVVQSTGATYHPKASGHRVISPRLMEPN
jgi:hypothetical protein